jgi:hypothetical protein
MSGHKYFLCDDVFNTQKKLSYLRFRYDNSRRLSFFFCFTIESYRKTWVIVTVKNEKVEIFTITGLSFSSYRNGEKWPHTQSISLKNLRFQG